MSNEDLKVVSLGVGNIIKYRPVFSKDGQYVFVASGKQVLKYNVDTGSCVERICNGTEPIISIFLHPENTGQLVTYSKSGTLMIFDIASGCIESSDDMPILEPDSFFSEFYDFRIISKTMYVALVATPEGTSVAIYDIRKGHWKLRFERGMNDGPHSLDVGGNGEYIAAISTRGLFVDFLQNHEISKKMHMTERPFTTVACHPKDYIIATGDVSGRILIWHDFHQNRPVKTEYHWHSLPVSDICFSDYGSYFYSGGDENVLVKWNMMNAGKQFLPRMGMPIKHIVVGPNNNSVSVSQDDNSIRFVNSHMKMVQQIQGFSQCLVTPNKNLFPAGIAVDPRTNCIVMNGKPGHIQFYNTYQNDLLYNLDITGLNLVTGERNKIVPYTDVTRIAFSEGGTWFATVEEREERETRKDITMKFWLFNQEKQEYELNTTVSFPHEDTVKALEFRPLSGDTFQAVTCGDKCSKIWELIDASSIYRRKQCWDCRAAIKYRDLLAGDISYSDDGSILALSFGYWLTLRSADTAECKLELCDPRLQNDIVKVAFGRKSNNTLVICVTGSELYAYSIKDSRAPLWILPLKIAHLCVDPLSEYMAVISCDNNVFVFSPAAGIPSYIHRKASESIILAAAFVPRQRKLSEGLPWHCHSSFCFIDETQTMCTFATKGEPEPEPVHIVVSAAPSHHATPFSALVAKKKVKQTVTRVPSVAVKMDSSVMKDLLSTPSDTIMSIAAWTGPFLESLLVPVHAEEEVSGHSVSNPEWNRYNDSDSDSGFEQNDDKTPSHVAVLSRAEKCEVDRKLNSLNSSEKYSFLVQPPVHISN